jgi:hypothetical protein
MNHCKKSAPYADLAEQHRGQNIVMGLKSPLTRLISAASLVEIEIIPMSNFPNSNGTEAGCHEPNYLF